MNVIAPVVNLNGTSANELLEQVRDAAEAVRDAFKALQLAAPHGRDYQTAAPEAYRLARQQHNIWLGQLDDMHKALEAIGIQILDQMPNA